MNTMVITSWRKRTWGEQNLLILKALQNTTMWISLLYEPKKDRGKNAGSMWWLGCGKIQHKSYLPTINMGLLGGHCFYIKKMDVLCNRWECKGCRQIFTRNEDLTRHLKEERCTGGKTKIICSGGKFKHILNSSEKVFYGGDTKFSYTACQWIEAQAIETGKHIHHKMCRHGGKEEPASFLVDGYEPETNTVYQLYGCHWHWHTCLKNRTERQKYNLVSTWECEQPILKRMRFEKKFTPYPHFIVYGFETILVPLNEHPTEDLIYLCSWYLSKEPVFLVHKNPEHLVEQFIEVLTEKQKAIAADVLKKYPYPSDFQMLPGEVEKQ